MNTRRLVSLSLMAALSIALYYLESLIPPIVPVPGVKLGLANLIFLFVLYYYDGPSYLFVVIVKVLVVALIGQGFGITFLMSAFGSLLSVGITLLLYYSVKPSIFALSSASSLFHVLGQLLAYAIFFENFYIYSYLAILGPLALGMGALIGLLDYFLILRLPQSFRNEEKKRRR